MLITSNLLRERFSVRLLNEGEDEAQGNKPTLNAPSNRMVLNFGKEQKGHQNYVVRAQTMHLTVRIAAEIVGHYMKEGPLLNRQKPFRWTELWSQVDSDYQRQYFPEHWAAIYNQGNTIFEHGKHSPFLDMIEKCDHENDEPYEFVEALAEERFRQSGKGFGVEYESNTALIVNLEPEGGKCSIIDRSPLRTTTFSIHYDYPVAKDVNVSQALHLAANWLEGIQIAFLIGMNQQKIKMGIIKRDTKENDMTKSAEKRLESLGQKIDIFERSCKLIYRSEKPNLKSMVYRANQFAEKALK